MTMMTNDADILIALFHNLLLDLKYKLSVSTSLLWFAGLMTHTQKQNSKSVGFCLSLHSHHFKASKKLVEKRRVGLNKIHWTMIFAGERFWSIVLEIEELCVPSIEEGAEKSLLADCS